MSDKKLCGLWGAHVKVSELNKHGACECLNCAGNHCAECSTFAQYVAKAVKQREKTNCFLCQTFRGNIK